MKMLTNVNVRELAEALDQDKTVYVWAGPDVQQGKLVSVSTDTDWTLTVDTDDDVKGSRTFYVRVDDVDEVEID